MENIRQQEKDNRGDFYIEVDGERKGSLRYLLFDSGRMVLVHTEVSAELKGQGAGRKLLNRAVRDARERGFRILPQCPYARRVMYKNREEFQDVLI